LAEEGGGFAEHDLHEEKMALEQVKAKKRVNA